MREGVRERVREGGVGRYETEVAEHLPQGHMQTKNLCTTCCRNKLTPCTHTETHKFRNTEIYIPHN